MSAITESARGERCTIQILDACRHDTSTTVFCHSNEFIHGKGVGKKSMVIFGAYGCQVCHDIYDRRRRPPEGMPYAEAQEAFRRGNVRTLIKLMEKGLVVCK